MTLLRMTARVGVFAVGLGALAAPAYFAAATAQDDDLPRAAAPLDAGRGAPGGAAAPDIALAALAPVPRPGPQRAPVPRPDSAAAAAASASPAVAPSPAPDPAAEPARLGPVTALPLPRFVSLGASEANVRRGPSRSHRIDWVFTRRGMPVMVVAEHGNWRRVVDRDGAGGWVHYALLSGVRAALVEEDMLALHVRPDAASPVRARAERGVVAQLAACRQDWCLVDVGGYRGWAPARALWGVRPGEVFD